MATSQTFTATDVAAFANLIRPAFDRIADEPLAPADRVFAAAMLTREDEEHAFSRRLISGPFEDYAVGVLSGTYDEFRAEGRQ